MKFSIGKIIVTAIIVITATLYADGKTGPKPTIVVSASDLPELAQRNSQAMYLYRNGGQTVLYLEQDQGRTLSILDVSDPAAIRAVTQVSVAAPSSYDFVKTLGDSAVLIHYRDHSGFAVFDLKEFKKPVLTEAPQLQHNGRIEAFGNDGLLLTSTARAQVEDPQYEVIDASNPSSLAVLATVKGVEQFLEKTDTGTVFFLSSTGLTVIRRPNVEAEYRNQVLRQSFVWTRW